VNPIQRFSNSFKFLKMQEFEDFREIEDIRNTSYKCKCVTS